MTDCTCENIRHLNGREIPEWPDPDCPTHGLRDAVEKVPLLRGHRINQAGVQESPRAVQQRLYREATGK